MTRGRPVGHKLQPGSDERRLRLGRENYRRLLARGRSPTRDIERRLAWKRSRGIGTTAEDRPAVSDPKNPSNPVQRRGRSDGLDFTSFFKREVLRLELGTPQWILYAAAAFDSVVEHPQTLVGGGAQVHYTQKSRHASGVRCPIELACRHTPAPSMSGTKPGFVPLIRGRDRQGPAT